MYSSPSNLPEPTTFITSHDPSTGNSIILPPRSQKWDVVDQGRMPLAVAYINTFPADLNDDADLVEYDRKMAAGSLGLVNKGNALLRYVDLAPGYTCMMHRTQSIDYGILLEGEVECVMDGGQVQRMRRGDVMVQRYTKHAWRNPDESNWARVVFVLMDCEPLVVRGERLREDLGRGKEFLNGSGNDA